jgi:hypothetical protein
MAGPVIIYTIMICDQCVRQVSTDRICYEIGLYRQDYWDYWDY